MIEYYGHILPGYGSTRGIVAFPEQIQEFMVCDLIWVVVDLNGLGVIAQVVIGGSFLRSPGVSYTGTDNSLYAPEPGIRSPESA